MMASISFWSTAESASTTAYQRETTEASLFCNSKMCFGVKIAFSLWISSTHHERTRALVCSALCVSTVRSSTCNCVEDQRPT
jgi:hypothetical protein